MESASVPSCSAEMSGQIRKTKLAGVTSVPKSWLKAWLLVAPTFWVIAARREVAAAGMDIFMDIIVIEMSPKYESDARAAAWPPSLIAGLATSSSSLFSARYVREERLRRARMAGFDATRGAPRPDTRGRATAPGGSSRPPTAGTDRQSAAQMTRALIVLFSP